MQGIINHEISTFAEALFADGQLMKGGKCIFEDKKAKCQESILFAQGFTHEISYKEIVIGDTETVTIGIRLEQKIVTYLEDPDLVDPAEGTQNHNEPGADRLQFTSEWAREDELTGTPEEEFYPIHDFKDGGLINPVLAPPTLDSTREMLARYDNAANGSYVDFGLEVQFEENDTDGGEFHVCFLDQGCAHVEGYEIEYAYAVRFNVKWATDVREVTNESQVFVGDGKYRTRWNPIARVTEIDGIKQITTEVKRGQERSGSDLLSPRPVNKILEVKQSTAQGASVDLIFIQGTDYQHLPNTDYVDWLATGDNQPDPGEMYTITYWYNAQVDPFEFTPGAEALDIRGFAPGTDFRIDYEFFLPRSDRVVLNRHGEIKVLEGVPDILNPLPPESGEGLAIAVVRCEYGKEPKITMDYFKAFKMSDIQHMLNRIEECQYNIARLSLQEDIRGTDPATIKKNIFVDPFFDDDMFDHGMKCTCMAFGSVLLPGMDMLTTPIKNGDEIWLPFSEVSVIRQGAYSKARHINELTWSAAPPAQVKITPQTHTWINTRSFRQVFRGWTNRTTSSSGSTTNTVWGWSWWGRASTTEVSTQTSQSTSRSTSSEDVLDTQRDDGPAVIPRISIQVIASVFNAGEEVLVTLDGKSCGSGLHADGNGDFNQTVTVPAGVRSGSKELRVTGAESGVTGARPFTATPLREIRTRTTTTVTNINTNTRTIRTVRRWNWQVRNDPLAQTFEVDYDCYTTSAEIRFTAAPTTFVDVFLCETVVGFPDRNRAVAEARLRPAACLVNSTGQERWTKFDWINPVRLNAGIHYCMVVECTDSNAAISVAKLGDRNNAGKWMTTQAYDAGILLQSANGVTWTPIQTEDMAFAINRAQFVSQNEVILGTGNVQNATDLMLGAECDILPGTAIEFSAYLLDRLVNGKPSKFVVVPDDPLTIENYTGRLQYKAILKTDSPLRSPAIGGDVELTVGTIKFPSQYICRAWKCDGDNININIDQLVPTVACSIEVFFQDSTQFFDPADGFNIGDMTGNAGLTAAFNSVTDQPAVQCAMKTQFRRAHIGKRWGDTEADERVVTGFKVTSSNDQGFRGNTDASKITAFLLGGDTDDPTVAHVLGQITRPNTPGMVLEIQPDNVESNRMCLYHWVKLESDDLADDKDWYVAEVQFYVQSWVKCNPQPDPNPLGDGWTDMTYKGTGLSGNKTTRIKIVLDSQDNTERPSARNLRAYVH